MFQRQALVIGNDNYRVKPRRTCVNDANDISCALRTIGFISHCATNLESQTMLLRINRFRESIAPNAIVVVYFSGRAVQYNGHTYLMPIDNDWISSENVGQSAYNAEEIIGIMHTKGPRAVILILDCARPYQTLVGETPFFVDREPLGLLQGMAPVQPPPSTIIANSCEAGATFFGLADNYRNSIYTYHLLRYITRPNIDIDTVFRCVALNVEKSTNGRQRPDRYSSVYELLYLVINSYSKNLARSSTMQPDQQLR
ncbi:unnamed protein product [Adineta steineri]|uniref:Peptidase C14 caspase domain-containing protein n=1 Tax=Adineta steineri TaxID=433720 RepID=A0A813MFA3_9BILA|nr:unnamed protein product [Adineta steineri]CAF4123506.1 unnamed protein product [Adineta steineri]